MGRRRAEQRHYQLPSGSRAAGTPDPGLTWVVCRAARLCRPVMLLKVQLARAWGPGL